jgi:hypothetical protein
LDVPVEELVAELEVQVGAAGDEFSVRRSGYVPRCRVGHATGSTPQDLVPRVGLRMAIAQIDRSSEGVDPPVETASLAGEDARIAEGVGEQRAALIGSEKAHGEVVRVAAAQCPELLLSPLDRNAH